MNLKLLEFTLGAIVQKRAKNMSLFFGLFFSVFIFCAILFCAIGIKKEILKNIAGMPEITIQKVIGGRAELIEVDRIDKLLEINGIEAIADRVWGYYYFPHRRLENGGVNFTIIGANIYGIDYKESLAKLSQKHLEVLKNGKAVVGKDAYSAMQKGYFEGFFDFYPPSGGKMRVEIGGVEDGEFGIEGSDAIIISQRVAREVLGIPMEKAVDIILKVPNEKEVDNIVGKIKDIYSDVRIITKSDLISSYNGLFDYKSGLFLALFITSIWALFLLIFEKASGLGDDEKREIATLRAIGWRVSDVMALKFLEHSIISLFAFGVGILGAYFFVFVLDAPFVREVFMGYSELRPPFRLQSGIEVLEIIGVVLIGMILYLSLVLLPIWKGATLNVSEHIK